MSIKSNLKQRGVGILEVLIALIVVSIGVLGLAGMQLNGMRVAKGSYNRSQAVLYTETIIAQMRANPEAAALGRYSPLTSVGMNCDTKPTNYCSAFHGSSPPTPECASMADRVENDFYSVVCGHWTGSAGENGVIDNLPEGVITINCDGGVGCGANDIYTVTISWTETEVADGVDVASTKQVTMRVLP